jgi:hypothetical protein
MQTATLNIATSSSHSHPMQARSISWYSLSARLTQVIGGAKEGRGWAGIASGKFPLPVKCGRRSFWPQSVIAEFIENLKRTGV